MNNRLEEAFRSFRAESIGESRDADRTLERVLGTTRKARVARRRSTWLVLPIAAVLVASSAWAFETGALSRAWRAVTTDHSVPSASGRSLGATNHSGLGGLATDSAKPSEPVSTDLAPSSSVVSDAPSGDRGSEASGAQKGVEAQRAATESAKTRVVAPFGSSAVATGAPATGATAKGAPLSVAKSSASGEVADPKIDLLALDKTDFERAYRTHASGSASAALAWDDYLSAHPAGRFVPEARFARAVALVRAGRGQEAREAFRPFAEAAPGAYRREDALRWLETLDSAVPKP